MKLPALRRFAVGERLGVPGVVGAGLLLFGVAFYFGANAPARAELSDLTARRDRLAAAEQAGQAHAAAPAQRLPPIEQAPELLKQLGALAEKNGISVTRSTYQVRAEDSQRVFAVDLPLRVGYPELRSYLRDVFVAAPTARLDSLSLRRSQASDPLLDAELRLSFLFAAAS